MEDIGSEEGYACAGAKDLWDSSVPFCQFCREPKTAL